MTKITRNITTRKWSQYISQIMIKSCRNTYDVVSNVIFFLAILVIEKNYKMNVENCKNYEITLNKIMFTRNKFINCV